MFFVSISTFTITTVNQLKITIDKTHFCPHCNDKLERLSLTWISTFYCEVYYRIDPRIVKRKGRKEIERSSLNEYVCDTKRGKIKAKKAKRVSE